MGITTAIARLGAALLGACAFTAAAQPSAPGAGLPTTTWAAGTKLAEFPHGGRIATFHRGKLLLSGTDNQSVWAYDISNPTQPNLLCTGPTLGNSHVWYKVGDLFFRQDLLRWSQPPNLYDLRTNFCNPARWNTPIHDFPLNAQIAGDDWMPTYPYAFTGSVLDARVGWWPSIVDRNLRAEAGVEAYNRFRIGNLLFFTPGDGGHGVAVFDIGDPARPRLLDVLSGNYQQYTTTWHVWRHYLVMMAGHNQNGPDSNANALVVDFSDPTNLHIAWTIPRDVMRGRYVHFQDQYAFAGHVADNGPGGYGVKYDMVNQRVVQTFRHTNTGTDFQWIPIGHLMLVTGSETTVSASVLYAHQDGLDRTPPTIGYHLPLDGAINQPVRTGVGLVINEQLDATTVNEQTIQLRPVGGNPVPAIVMHTSYDVVSVIPVNPLQADTTYEVRLVENGVRDLAGNAMAPHSFFFSTGNTLQTAPRIVSTSVTQPSPALVGESLTFAVQAENAVQYSWDFGDGSAVTGWSASTSATHAFAVPGVYTASVQARSAANQTASATVRLVVDAVPAATAPAASASILVAGDRVWVANPDNDSVAVFDAASRARVALHDVHAACDDPRSLARDSAGRVWIACRGDDRLVALDANGNAAGTLNTGYGSAPEAVLFDASGSVGYATLESGAVVHFNPATATETLPRVELGFAAEALARAGNRLYAARLKSANDAGRIAAIELPGFTLATDSAGAPGIALPLDTTSPDSGTAGRGLPNYVAALAVSPDAQRVWYAAKKDNILRGLARENTELDFEKTVRAMVGGIDAGTATEVVADRFDFDNSTLALALSPSPGGAILFAALAGNDRVVALDPWHRAELARADVGAAPRGLAVDPVRKRLWVRNDLGRNVTVLDISALTTDGTPAMTVLGTGPSIDTDTLAANVLAGKRLFWSAGTRLSADGYLACASCHLDGGGDGRVWDFTQRGEGLRRTLPLLGRAGTGQGPLHWTANFDEVQDFEHDIRNEFGGTGLMSNALFFAGTRDEPLGDRKAGQSADLDALAAYAGSLDRVGRSPYRVDANTLSASATAGRALFQQSGCARCHGGAAFTDSAQRRWHDVGTVAATDMRAGRPLQGFDTPTLRGLWREGSYLHDGRSADPIAALLASGARHGAVAALSTAERQQLLDYLRSIDDNEPAAPAPFALQVTSPAANAQPDPGRPVDLVATTDLADLAGIDVLLDGVVVATDNAAPWQASFTVTAGSRPALQLRARHASGALTFTAPTTLRVGARVGAIFADGLE
jgi:DNA-binding beta-propeller fold protein YncE